MNIVLLNIKVLHYEYLFALHYKNTQKSIPTTPIANFFQNPKKILQTTGAQVQAYWCERMLGARPRTRRAAKRNGMERFCEAK